MTSSGSVGTGIAMPLATEFFRKYGLKAHASHFIDFARAKKLKRGEAREVQEALLRQFHVYGVGTALPDDLVEAKPAPPPEATAYALKTLVRTVAAAVASQGDAPGAGAIFARVGATSIIPGAAPVIGSGASGPAGMPSAVLPADASVEPEVGRRRKKKKKHHGFNEGLGYADDSDGRGGGVSGGSRDSDGPQQATELKRCRRCGTGYIGDECTRCGAPGEPSQSSKGGQGVNNKGTFGNVRVPGGAIDTNEGPGGVLIRSLGDSLVEIDVGGVVTTHQRQVLLSALDHRLSIYGPSYKSKLQGVVEWVWERAEPGDALVLDLHGKRQYVVNRRGFKYHYDG